MIDLIDALSDAPLDDITDRGRIYGWLPGVVTDITDPQTLGRIRARFGAQDKGEQSDWLVPGWGGATEQLPRVGDPVALIFMDGDPHRGMYLCHAKLTTQNRPTEFMVLGTTAMGLLNNLATQFNTLRNNFNSFVTTYNSHYHTGTSPTDLPSASGTSTSATAAGFAKHGDGSNVTNITATSIALSREAKVR